MKTVNLNDRHSTFQPDTGPVLFPNLDVEPEELLANVNLAFLAWNAYPGSPHAAADGLQLGVAEFLVRVPTKVVPPAPVASYAALGSTHKYRTLVPDDVGSDEGVLEVLHYSQSVRVQARHAVFEIP